MKIVQNNLKTEEKFSDVPKKFRVGPKKVGSVGFPEARHFFFGLSGIGCVLKLYVKFLGPHYFQPYDGFGSCLV